MTLMGNFIVLLEENGFLTVPRLMMAPLVVKMGRFIIRKGKNSENVEINFWGN
jgi:hypothetical protein